MTLLRQAKPLFVAALAAVLLAAPALAGGAIEVVHPWARPTIIPKRPGVAYLGIHNQGTDADRLIGGRAAGVGKVEIHRAEQKGGVMTMSRVKAIDVPAGGMIDLGPGGFHLMLFGLEAPLKDGDTVEMTLTFERAGDVSVAVPVTRSPARAHGHGAGHQHETTGN